MGNSLTVPQKVKHGIALWLSHPAPGEARIIESMCSPKNLYTKVHCNIAHNCWIVEIIHMSISWRKGKQNVVYPYGRTIWQEKKWHSFIPPISTRDLFLNFPWVLNSMGVHIPYIRWHDIYMFSLDHLLQHKCFVKSYCTFLFKEHL